jgi:hypothetical protein
MVLWLEPYVDADCAANFLSLTRRRVLELARARKLPGHPIGDRARHIWRFRLSEIAAAVSSTGKSCFASMERASIVRPGQSPALPGRKAEMSQRGWLTKQKRKKDGRVWIFHWYRVRPSDGKHVENTVVVGRVASFPKESSRHSPTMISSCGRHGSAIDYIVRTVDRCSAIRCKKSR